MEISLKRQRASLRKRFAPIEGTDRPACAMCGPPKTAVFHDSRRGHDLCGKCAAQRWERCWAKQLAGAVVLPSP